MKTKLLMLTLAVLLLCASVSAVTTNYETSSVARIVGNSVADLQNQVNHPDMNLKHATNSVHTSAVGDTTDHPAQLYSIFRDNVGRAGGIDSLDSGEYGNFQNGEFLIHKASGSASSSSTSVDYVDKQGLEQKAQNGNILFISDADYSGLYLRKIDTFNKNILTKTPTIAPTYRRSSLFGDSFVCNMALWGNLGEIYRNARNAYYKNADKNEFLGLTLMSYHLFGNPLIQINTPSTTLSTNELTKYCRGLLADTESRQPISQFSIESADNSISREYDLDLSNYNVTTEDNQTAINIPGGVLTTRDGELYLPSETVSDTFPDKTIITSVSDPVFSNPVDLNVAGAPIWDGLNLQDQCFTDQQNESFEKSHAITDQNEEQVIMNIIPFKVLNCATRDVRLYQSISFTIDYTPYSPLLIEDIKATAEDLPEAIVPIQINLKSVQDSPEEGYLRILQNGTIVSLWPINSTDTNAVMNLTLPDTEGTWDYTLDFYEGNTTRTSRDFQITTRTLTSEIQQIETPRGATTAVLTVNNPSTRELDSTVSYELSNAGTVEKNSINAKLAPGDNNITLTFSALESKEESYFLTATAIAEDKSTTTFSTIVTDYAPTIENENIVVNEGDSVSLLANATDTDGDATTNNLNSPFVDKTFNNDESGTYLYTIDSSDGIKSSQKTFSITVLNVNQAPWLNVSDSIAGKENETIKLNAIYGDPDNENSDPSDNNNLTITYGHPFNNNDSWTPTFDDSGEYSVDVTVDDGEVQTIKTINVSIANTNRAPIITIYNQTTSEGAAEIKTISVADPDNTNTVDNDDNNLTIICKGDTINKTSTNASEECAVSYPFNYTNSTKQDTIAVSVSDGELTTQDNVHIQVNNTNRPPVITQNNMNVTEGDIVKVTPEITDPDNTNGNENTLTTTYGGVLNASGEWQTTTDDSGTRIGTIIVSDGITQTTKDITINVKNFNRAPVISNITDITAKEGETITLNVIVTDPDNENNATTDDQTTTVTVSPPFVNKIWYADYNQSGDYEINITASDGQSETVEQIKVIVLNTNRPPYAELLLGAHEGDNSTFLTPADLDNENSVTNDDNILTIWCSKPLNLDCTWDVDYFSAGNYTINATINDGFITTNLTGDLEISNVNRAPMPMKLAAEFVTENGLEFVNGHYSHKGYEYANNQEINSSASAEIFVDRNDVLNLSINFEELDRENTTIDWYGESTASGEIDPSFGWEYFLKSKDDSEELAKEEFAKHQILGSSQIFNLNGVVSNITLLVVVSDGESKTNFTFNIHSLDRISFDNQFGELDDNILHYSPDITLMDDVSSVDNFVLRNNYGMIEFLEPVDLSKGVLADRIININHRGSVYVDTHKLTGLNKPARITFYGLPDATSYKLMMIQNKYSEDSCPSNICTDIVRNGNSISFNVPNFSPAYVYLVRPSNKQEYSLELLNASIDAGENDSVELTTTITNTGLYAQDIELTTSIPGAEIKPKSIKLTADQSKEIKIKAPVKEGIFNLYANGKSTATSQLTITKPKLIEITVRAQGKGDLVDGAIIKKNLGDIVELKVTVKNNAKNTTLFIPTIQGTLSGLDEEQSDEQDIAELQPGEEDTVTLRLPLPLLSADSSGNIDLEILAETDKGEQYNFNNKYKLNLKEEKHDLTLDLSPETLQCGKEFSVESVISNAGSSDEDVELTIAAFNSTQTTNISISKGEKNRVINKFLAPNMTSSEMLEGTLTYSGKSTQNTASLILNCGGADNAQANLKETSKSDISDSTPEFISDNPPDTGLTTNKVLLIVTVGLLIILFEILLAILVI